MLFTLDKINVNFSYLLPGIRLGALVMDTCGSDYIALERSLEIVQTAAVTDGAAISGVSRENRIDYTTCLRQSQQHDPEMRIGLGLMPGLIGAASSTESIQVASLFRLFRIPMISYASTSAELSDKKRYEFFARTVPSDIYQSKAVIDILLSFDWTYVSVVYSDGDYGSSLFEAFQRRASGAGICIAHIGKLTKRGEMNEFREHVRILVEKERARVVVLFIAAKDVRPLLKAVTLEIPADRLPYFQFVASDGWGTQKALLSDSDASLASEGAITLEIKTAPLPGFDDYFKKLVSNPQLNTRNPWFGEFCEANRLARQHQSQMLSTQGIRNYYKGPSCMNDDYQQDSKNIFVHNAVYSFALALRELQRRHCGRKHTGLCDQLIQNLQAVNVFRTILNVTFTDPIGRSVKFDEFGDAVGHYNIYKYRRQPGILGGIGGPYSTYSQSFYNLTTAVNAITASSAYRFQYDRVGEWNGRLQIARSMRLIVPVINQTKVRSKCSEPCEIGQAMRILIKGCCWECFECSPHQIVTANASHCTDCADGYWPDYETRSFCIKLTEKHLDMLSWYVILSATIASLGMLATTIAIIAYVKFLDTPLVKASSVELSFIILAGCFVTFLTTFFYLSWPSLPVCMLRRLLFGLGIASIYSAVAVKINRIYRIFEAATKSSQQPPMISPESQLMLVACFVGVQLGLSVVSLLFDPPDVSDFNPSGDRLNWYKTCATTARSYALLMALTIILIVGATYYAIRTRNCPEPYREARVVGFSVYTTFIIWLAFVPLFFTTSSSVELRTTVISISLSLCGWVILACLFGRRIYIILFQPSKNVKPGKFTLSAAMTKNAAQIVAKMALPTGEKELPSLQEQSSCQIRQNRPSVTATSMISRSNINTALNQTILSDDDSNTNTTATRALMFESAAATSATIIGITAIAQPKVTANSSTVVELKKEDEPSATVTLLNEQTVSKSPLKETVVTIVNQQPIQPSPSHSRTSIRSRTEPDQEPLLSHQPQTDDEQLITSTAIDEERKRKLSTVSRESSEILDEIRSTSTSSYALLRKDCLASNTNNNLTNNCNTNDDVDTLLFDQLSISDLTLHGVILKPVPVTTAAARPGVKDLKNPQHHNIAPIASISSMASNNLPTGDRTSLGSSSYPSSSSSREECSSLSYDATVIDGAALRSPEEDARTSTATKIAYSSSSAASDGSSQDDIASILERHEQLTTLHGGRRVIAIYSEAVIDL